mgnify:CR=1 FL=1
MIYINKVQYHTPSPFRPTSLVCQQIMVWRSQRYVLPVSSTHWLPVLQPKWPSKECFQRGWSTQLARCHVPVCSACRYAKAKTSVEVQDGQRLEGTSKATSGEGGISVSTRLTYTWTDPTNGRLDHQETVSYCLC